MVRVRLGVNLFFHSWVRAHATHALYNALWGAQVPIAQAPSRMQVGVDFTKSNIQAFVSSSSNSMNLNWFYFRDYLLELGAKMWDRGCNLEYMIFIWNFVLIERRHITWYSSQQSFSWKFLVILKHEAAMLERAKSCSSKVLIFLVEGIMDDTNLGNSIDSQSYEYRDCR